MELKAYLTIIARRWYIVLLVTLLVTAGAIYATRYIPAKYQAETDLRVITPLGGTLGDVSYQTTYAIRLMNTYTQLASSDQVINEVKQQLHLDKNPDVTVKTVPDSEIIQITIGGTDPKEVANTANALANLLIAKGQVNVVDDSSNSAELGILSERGKVLQTELAQAKEEYQNLSTSYSQTTGKLAVLDMTIKSKEDFYRNLQNQYQQAQISEAVAVYALYKNQYKTTGDILNAQLANLDTELGILRQQYQELSEGSARYNQQLVVSSSLVQSKQKALQDFETQYNEARIASLKHESAQTLMIASPATVPTRPIGLSPMMIAGIGVLGGLMAGIMLAFLLDAMDTRILKTEQIRMLIDAPILGRLPNLGRKDKKDPLESKDALVQKAYWTICTKLLVMLKDRPIKTILMTSPNPSEGKSTVILGVAAGLAKAGKKVLVIDTDMRKPRLHTLFNVSNEQGLSTYITGENTSPDKVILKNVKRGIDFLPSGPELDDPTDLLQVPQLSSLLEKVSDYDVILLDSPALLAVPDAYNIATAVDSVLLVVQRGRTSMEDVKTVQGYFKDINHMPLGVIINRVPEKRISGNYYQRGSRRNPHFSIRLPGF